MLEHEKKSRISKQEILRLAAAVLLILLVNLYYLGMKSGYYVDEGMTLFLANGHYNGAVTAKSEQDIGDFIRTYVWKEGDGPADAVRNVAGMLKELKQAGNYSRGGVAWYDDARNMLQGKSSWISGEELKREITAQRGERFQYGQVYLNQVMDVHPLFYYLIVHTVFSLFPGMYADAFLFGINMVFLTLTCLILYLTVREFCKDTEAALLSVILYGFSQGFISCAVYFRMYAVLTFFVMLTLYDHLKLEAMGIRWLERKKNTVLLGITVFLGFNTHYYYILFLFPLFVYTCIRIRKEKKLLGRYLKGMVISGLISLVIWPFSVYHILFGYRGTEAVSNVLSSGIFGKLYGYIRELGKAFFLGNLFPKGSVAVVVLLLIAVPVLCIVRRKQGKKDAFLDPQMLIPVFVYLVIVAQIAPSVADRYIMCLFPVLAMIIVLAVREALSLISVPRRVRDGILAVLGVLYMVLGFLCIEPNYLFLEQRGKQLELSGDKSEYQCLMIGSDHGQGFSEAVKLSEFGKVLVVGMQETDAIAPLSEDSAQGTVIYIFNALEVEEVLSLAAQKMELGGDYEEIPSDIDCFRAFVYQSQESK